MTTQDCFQTATRIETLLRNLNLGLARCFRADPPAAAAFRTLAARVEQRALRIRLLALQRGGNARSGDTLERLSADLVTVLVDLSALAVNVRNDPNQGSGYRMLKQVIDADRRCHAAHAAVLRRSADPVVLGLFSALARQDVDNERLLGRVQEASRRGRPFHPARRSAHAPSWTGGGSFGVAWRAREGGHASAPSQSA